jgi:Protein of unknown function (DUF2958)
MKLLTKALETKLLANGDAQSAAKGTSGEIDFVPVVKFFNPAGAATWLFTEMARDLDTLFGLCDLGMGEPELDSVSFSELADIRTHFGLKIERDLWFKGNKPLSAYATEAREKGRIVA